MENKEIIDKSKEEKIRLIISKTDSFLEQLALDEVQTILLQEERIKPTLRISYFKKPIVLLGFFKRINEEINIENCKRFGIEIGRTLTNLETTYKEPNSEINFSFIINDSNINIPLDLLNSYQKIFSLISKVLESYNIKADFKPLNNTLVNNKKIAFMTQLRKRGVILFNVSILLSTKKEDSKKFVIKEKGEITSISEEIKNNIEQKEIEKLLIDNFSSVFKTELEKEELTKEEKELAEQLYKEKYSSNEWVYYR